MYGSNSSGSSGSKGTPRGFTAGNGLVELPVNVDFGYQKPAKPTMRYTSVSPIPLPSSSSAPSSASSSPTSFAAEEEAFIVPEVGSPCGLLLAPCVSLCLLVILVLPATVLWAIATVAAP